MRPGGTLEDLTEELEKNTIFIPPRDRITHKPTHVYILAGVTDITTKLSHKHPYRYKESIYNGTPDSTIVNIKEKMAKIADTITQKGATPIFCTIAGINIRKYNISLRDNHKTTTLHHEHSYDTMQTKVEHIIREINNHITDTNSRRGVATPLFHTAILKRHGRAPRGYYKFHWEGLYDGIHATRHTRDQWAFSLTRAIEINRGDTPTKRKAPTPPRDIPSPKRSWRNERKLLGL